MSERSALTVEAMPDGVKLRFAGALTLATVSHRWREVFTALRTHAQGAVTLDLSGVEGCDAAGVALLAEVHAACAAAQRSCTLHNVPPQVSTMLGLLDFEGLARPVPIEHHHRENLFEHIGAWALELASGVRSVFVFIGDACLALLYALRHPRSVRARDVLLYLERAGVDAVPIVALIQFLLGVTLALLGASQLRQFGANIYVADLVGIAMVQEIGPLMTAIIVAGRSGAAFAAEIGTMKVSEEVDALIAMGFNPQRVLVLPKVLAVALAMPCLLLIANVVGICGGAAIGVAFLDISLTAYFNETYAALDLWMVMQGLIKALVFAVLVAGIGCLRGLQVQSGAESVGRQTTSAVVSGIFMIIVANAIFTVLFQYL